MYVCIALKNSSIDGRKLLENILKKDTPFED